MNHEAPSEVSLTRRASLPSRFASSWVTCGWVSQKSNYYGCDAMCALVAHQEESSQVCSLSIVDLVVVGTDWKKYHVRDKEWAEAPTTQLRRAEMKSRSVTSRATPQSKRYPRILCRVDKKVASMSSTIFRYRHSGSVGMYRTSEYLPMAKTRLLLAARRSRTRQASLVVPRSACCCFHRRSLLLGSVVLLCQIIFVASIAFVIF